VKKRLTGVEHFKIHQHIVLFFQQQYTQMKIMLLSSWLFEKLNISRKQTIWKVSSDVNEKISVPHPSRVHLNKGANFPP